MSQADAINSIAAEVPDWLQSVIDIPDPPHGEPAKLQRISPILRQNNEEYYKKYYTPISVPIGPIHCRNLDGQSMKDLKQKAVRELAKRVKDEVSIGEVYASVEEKLLNARNRYSCDIIESFQDDREWCELMFLDGCFVVKFICDHLFLLVRFGRSFLNTKKHDLLRDLYLYENQLPFELLHLLIISTVVSALNLGGGLKQLNQVPHHGEIVIPADSILQYYLNQLNIIFGRSRSVATDDDEDAAAAYIAYVASDAAAASRHAASDAASTTFVFKTDTYIPTTAGAAGAPRPPSTVTELKKVGIKCSGSTSLSDISFYSNMLSGKLFIPQLTFDHWSKILILNLAAYEFSCNPKYGSSGISSYLSSISTFIHGEEDVKELRARGLVQLNHTDDDDHAVVDFFRYIIAHHKPDSEVIRHVKRQISTYCESTRLLPLRVAYAEFKQRYFSGPWNFLVFLAVIFTVSMTIIQTIVTCIQTFKKD
ncbi:uncharacterized protein LOC132613324 [Lycium barbarum]|uniref:uncharacterized protein LOC132613324 n=1 Tax=Lycium barbarum TaxID=112863 RepID=UPI00293EB9A6|nr:uncharacterized protein LOC132613324 [Lycium barbarum]